MAVLPPARNQKAWSDLVQRLAKELQIEQGLSKTAVRSVYADLMDVWKRGASENLEARAIRNNMAAVLKTIEEEAHPGIRNVRAGRSANQQILSEVPREKLAEQIKAWRLGQKPRKVSDVVAELGVKLTPEELASLEEVRSYQKTVGGDRAVTEWAPGLDHPLPPGYNEPPNLSPVQPGWRDEGKARPIWDKEQGGKEIGAKKVVGVAEGGGDWAPGADPLNEAIQDAARPGKASLDSMWQHIRQRASAGADDEEIAALMEGYEVEARKFWRVQSGPPGRPVPKEGQRYADYRRTLHADNRLQRRYIELEGVAQKLTPNQRELAWELQRVWGKLSQPGSGKRASALRLVAGQLMTDLGKIPGVDYDRREPVLREMLFEKQIPLERAPGRTVEQAAFHEPGRSYNEDFLSEGSTTEMAIQDAQKSTAKVMDISPDRAGMREPWDMSEWKRQLQEMRKQGLLTREAIDYPTYRQLWNARDPSVAAAIVRSKVGGQELQEELVTRLRGGRVGRGDYAAYKLGTAAQRRGSHPAIREMLRAVEAGDAEGVKAAKRVLEATGDPGISLLLKNLKQPAARSRQLLKNVPKIGDLARLISKL